MIPAPVRPACPIRQAGDASWCPRCMGHWDTNDEPNPLPCQQKAKPGVGSALLALLAISLIAGVALGAIFP